MLSLAWPALAAASLALGQAGPPDHLHLTLERAGAQSPITGCAPEGLLIQLVDVMDVPVAQGEPVTLCAAAADAGEAADAVVLGTSTLEGEARDGGCVSGMLGDGGSASVTVTPGRPAGVIFTASSSTVPAGSATLPVQWVAGPPSLHATGLAPRDGPEPLVLVESGDIKHVRLTPRDECGFLPITESITVVIPTPLVAGGAALDADAGTVDFPVWLPECPSVVQPLFISARVNGALLLREDGGVRSLQVEPRCDTRVRDVGCGCASGSSSGRGAAALLLAAALAVLVRVGSGRARGSRAP